MFLPCSFLSHVTFRIDVIKPRLKTHQEQRGRAALEEPYGAAAPAGHGLSWGLLETSRFPPFSPPRHRIHGSGAVPPRRVAPGFSLRTNTHSPQAAACRFSARTHPQVGRAPVALVPLGHLSRTTQSHICHHHPPLPRPWQTDDGFSHSRK